MKRFGTIILLATSLIAGPVMADHENNLLSRENVGGAIGAAVGGFLGSKLGDGKARLATTAAGAVGGFLLGENVAKNYRPGGYSGYSGHSGYSYSEPARVVGYRQTPGYSDGDYRHATCCDDEPDYRDRLYPIHETYVAKCTSNVRSGPSTRYHVVGQLRDHERVQVIGKVEGRNWYMVRDGYRQGFVYAPLLRPAHYGHDDNERYGRYEGHDAAWRR